MITAFAIVFSSVTPAGCLLCHVHGRHSDGL